jgi:hypothetical protein
MSGLRRVSCRQSGTQADRDADRRDRGGVYDKDSARIAMVTRLLCVVILVLMLAALIYAGWIGVTNFSRIHV